MSAILPNQNSPIARINHSTDWWNHVDHDCLWKIQVSNHNKKFDTRTENPPPIALATRSSMSPVVGR